MWTIIGLYSCQFVQFLSKHSFARGEQINPCCAPFIAASSPIIRKYLSQAEISHSAVLQTSANNEMSKLCIWRFTVLALSSVFLVSVGLKRTFFYSKLFPEPSVREWLTVFIFSDFVGYYKAASGCFIPRALKALLSASVNKYLKDHVSLKTPFSSNLSSSCFFLLLSELTFEGKQWTSSPDSPKFKKKQAVSMTMLKNSSLFFIQVPSSVHTVPLMRLSGLNMLPIWTNENIHWRMNLIVHYWHLNNVLT